jgi:uncharacterized membrane protein
MNVSSLVWGSPAWAWSALALAVVGVAVLVWGYWRVAAGSRLKWAAGVLKVIGIAGLALCLVEPLLSGRRAKNGANMFAVVADNSQSMTVHDHGSATSRGQSLQALLAADSNWQQRLDDEFDARRFAFDAQLRAVSDFAALQFDGQASSLKSALNSLSHRFRSLPLAGVLVFTDGNMTDTADITWKELPPIYPVVMGNNQAPPDLSVVRISATQTNFESAPVVVRADVEASDFAGKKISAKLMDEHNRELQSQTLEVPPGDQPVAMRFEIRPEDAGVHFYRVHVNSARAGDSPERSEATLANNERQVVVDRGGGPYRVLYVCGRPNWEFKFLRRALADDDQLELVGLVRIARREPKFAFRRHAAESTNPLFSGFEHPDEEAAERYDQPVLIRLGTKDEHELRDGFPKTANELYQFDAVILDDVEAAYFTQDQLALVKNFVGRRGGGLLMLGGPDSLAAGKYDRTPIGSVLPVYCTSIAGLSEAGNPKASNPLSPFDAPYPFAPSRPDHEYRLSLTREGWLQPWVRTRKTEPEERERLATMAAFNLLSSVGGIKPAASVLAEVADKSGRKQPALVVQRYGRGRSAALLVGDLWRWGLKRADDHESDLEKSWRQTVRWLVADVPRRVEIEARPRPDSHSGAIELHIRVSDAEYLPLDNAQLAIEVTTPDGHRLPLDAEPRDDEPGAYSATLVPRQPGAYRVGVTAKAADGSIVGEREAGWIAQPAADEFKNLRPNRAALEEIAAKTGGEVVAAGDLDRFIRQLPNRQAPITEPWIRPAWHHPLFYLAIIACLCGEWGLRRWKGLP